MASHLPHLLQNITQHSTHILPHCDKFTDWRLSSEIATVLCCFLFHIDPCPSVLLMLSLFVVNHAMLLHPLYSEIDLLLYSQSSTTQWISNFIPGLLAREYLSGQGLKLNHISKRDHWFVLNLSSFEKVHQFAWTKKSWYNRGTCVLACHVTNACLVLALSSFWLKTSETLWFYF